MGISENKQMQPLKASIDLKILILGIMLVCSALTGILPQTVLSFTIVICMLALLIFDELYLAFPFLLFYNSFYGLFLGVSLFRIFSLLYIFLRIVKSQRNKLHSIRYFLPVSVYLVYSLTVLSAHSTERAVFAFIDIICCVLIVTGEIKNDEKKLKAFFTVYALVALSAYLTGTICGNALEQVERPGWEIVEYSRFMATFEDPNYMGFFYTIAVFAIVTLKLFKPILRFLLVIVLNIMILTSLSITAVIVNAILWLVYLAVSKKINIKVLVTIIVVIFLAILAYNYGLENGKDSFLGDLAYRIKEKLQEFERNNIGAVTTGRSDLAAYHLQVYKSLPLFKMLFGGISANTYYIDPFLVNAAHNEYVDMLLNIGLIGSLIMLGFFAYNIFEYHKNYLKEKNEKYLFLFMGKFVWVLYAFTLTVFLDYRFMIFFLL